MLGQEKLPFLSAMEDQHVPGGPINTVAEAFATPQVAAREMLINMPYGHAASGDVRLIGNPVKFSKTPVSYRHAPPVCGEHTEEVLAELLGTDVLPEGK